MFDVYQGAFYLPKGNLTDQAIPEISVVLFYNLALAHHLAGLAGLESFNTHLTEALHYYNLALKIYRSQDESTINRFALVLGCVTNMGHIYSHFWRVGEAKSCSNMLDQMLDSPDLQYLSVEDGEFFVSTMAYCSTQDCNLAPAA